MRFALLGQHPDGLAMARALTATGRHALIAYVGPKAGAEALQAHGLAVERSGDLEEILADPAVDVVIVAGRLVERPQQLRRALQSERHVLCVHPADQTPDSAYEAAMIQVDTRHVLLPLLPELGSPAVQRLAELSAPERGTLGKLQLIEVTLHVPEQTLSDVTAPGARLSLPIWSILRRLGGEIIEVSAFAEAEELDAVHPILLAGRFERGGLFQVTLRSGPPPATWVIGVSGTNGQARLTLTQDTLQSATLEWNDVAESHVETWSDWDPWPDQVTRAEAVLAGQSAGSAAGVALVSWQDEVRCLELDDAAHRSVQRRRVSALEYQEANEEVGFKGTMTLVGCGLLWSLLLLMVLAAWERRLLWLVIPVLLIFLGMQLLRWVIPLRTDASRRKGDS